MKQYCILCLLPFFSFSLFAQQENFGCATPPGKTKWLKKYQQNPSAYDRGFNAEVYIPISVQVIGSDEGTGFLGESKLLSGLCTLQEDFDESQIVFYLEHLIHLADGDFDEHETVIQGAHKMFEYNIENTINCYLMDDPAGNCGYNLPYAGVAVANNCNDASDHTWAHEMGHALTLPHPFLGWEGGVSHDGSIGHNFNDPAPDTIYYDYTNFQEVLYTDTLIVDTAIVERIDGSNCMIAADGFCDTAPDYLNSRWPCAGDGLSQTEQTDPNGIKFNSDGSLIMSYAFDQCSNRFTEEQSAAMRANALDELQEFVSTSAPSELIDYPLSIELYDGYDPGLDNLDVTLSWDQVENADYYLVQIGFNAALGAIFKDTIVKIPELIIDDLNASLDLFWKVTPFTKMDYCNLEGSPIIPLVTTDVTSNEDLTHNDIKLYPNPISKQQSLFIESDNDYQSVEIYDIQGRLMANVKISGNQITIPQDMEAGLYVLNFIGSNKNSMVRLEVI